MNYHNYYSKILESVDSKLESSNTLATALINTVEMLMKDPSLKDVPMIYPDDNVYELAVADLKHDNGQVSFNVYEVNDGYIDRDKLVTSETMSMQEFLDSTVWDVNNIEDDPDDEDALTYDDIASVVKTTESLSVNEASNEFDALNKAIDDGIDKDTLAVILDYANKKTASIYSSYDLNPVMEENYQIKGNDVVITGHVVPQGSLPKAEVMLKVPVNDFIKSIKEVKPYSTPEMKY